MIIKVCGMRDAQNIRKVEALGIDWIGLVFYPPSPRYVAAKPAYLPVSTPLVGVFVDADIRQIMQKADDYRLSLIQLHGHESPQYCNSLRAALPTVRIIKAISVAGIHSVRSAADYEGMVDYLLFDTHCVQRGGSGRTFDHHLLSHYVGQTPFLLSGGLSVADAEDLSRLNHPRLAGYDLNSRFESAPALKDTNLIQQFINHLSHQ